MDTEAQAKEGKGRKLGPARAVVFVVGSMVGAGIFGLPNSLGAIGTVSLIGLALAAVGALALAATFGGLAKHTGGEGGPFEYARDAFGNGAGFWTAWFFWLSGWATTAAVVVIWVSYCRYLLPGATWYAIVVGMVGLWLPVVVNLLGTRWMSTVQTVSVILAFIPLIVLCVVGPFRVTSALFGPFVDSGMSRFSAIMHSLTVSAIVFLGVEAVAVLSNRVRDPARNVSRASLIGTAICAALYLLATFVVFGTVSNEALRSGLSSFADSFSYITGSPNAGKLMAVTAVLSGFGGLVAWALLGAEVPRVAADARMFPDIFARTNARRVPAAGMIISTLLASALMVEAFAGGVGADVFDSIAVISAIGAGVVYVFCGSAEVRRLWRQETSSRHRILRMTAAVIGLVFSLVVIGGSLASKAMDALAFWMLLGWIAVGAAVLMRQRRRNATTKSGMNDRPVHTSDSQ